MAAQVLLYDTTLRDGTQQEGISLSLSDKLKIAKELDLLGIHYIEGGFPGSNPKDLEFFKKIKNESLKQARIVAFGSTRRKNITAEEDPNLKALLDSGAQSVCIFGKSWDMHVTSVLVTTLEENLKMIGDSINFLKKQEKEVIFDAEHFYDGYKNNPAYALETLKAAEEAGADWIVLCDTNGGTLPTELRRITQTAHEAINLPIGIHAHNDSGCAVANSLAAIEQGCTMVQGTINGYGERCGNADLSATIPNLVLKMNIACLDEEHLGRLTEVSHYVAEIVNIYLNPHHPYVGQSAFAHKGGVHISALLRQKGAYEHIDPVAVGNHPKYLVSELAGAGAVVDKAKEVANIDLSDKQDKVAGIIKKLKEHENQGYHYEVADGSFGLFVLKNLGVYKPIFELESYRVNIDRARSGKTSAEAIVKLIVDGTRSVVVGEGSGPVNALDRALRKALEEQYPDLAKSRLTDYKVRVLGEKHSTAAKVRVLVETSDAVESWGTIGVSENIIEASWQALVDSLEFFILVRHRE